MSGALLRAGLLIASLVVGGCSSDVLGPPMSSETANTASPVSRDDAVPSLSPSTPKAAFNPFADQAGADQPARVVIANPTLDQVMQPGPLPEMALGRADAPVTIIKYASMTCPYCRQFQLDVFPELKRRYIDTGKVRLIIREFPIGFQSGAATIALRCAPPEKYFELYGKLMAQQSVWVSQEVRIEPIMKVAGQVGLTRAQFDACRQNQSLVSALQVIKDRGRTLGIIGTPNFFINGKLYKSTFDLMSLKAVIDPLIAVGGALAIPARG